MNVAIDIKTMGKENVMPPLLYRPLDDAVEIMRKVHKATNGRPFGQDALATITGWSKTSSNTSKLLRDCIVYGILDKSASEASSLMKFTQDFSIFCNETISEKKLVWLESAAFKPPMMQFLWNMWGDTPPESAYAESELREQPHIMKPTSATLTVSVYKTNLKYAKGAAGIVKPTDWFQYQDYIGEYECELVIKGEVNATHIDELIAKLNQKKMELES